jgi:hypothetical protein
MPRIVKSALGNAPNQRHLSTFKSDANGTARSGRLAFATTSACLAMAARFALAKALSAVLCSGARLESM